MQEDDDLGTAESVQVEVKSEINEGQLLFNDGPSDFPPIDYEMLQLFQEMNNHIKQKVSEHHSTNNASSDGIDSLE